MWDTEQRTFVTEVVIVEKGVSPNRKSDVRLWLYHGSNAAIEHPDVSLNTGFSDLGRGFYLTDDREAARRRALTRSRRTGVATGVVSVFALEVESLHWVSMGASELPPSIRQPFGLRFDDDSAGLTAWVSYIQACRKGKTAIAGLGDPAVVRAWIATEEVELVCSGLATAEDLVPYLDASELLVQYCLRDQTFVDEHLSFIEAEVLPTD